MSSARELLEAAEIVRSACNEELAAMDQSASECMYPWCVCNAYPAKAQAALKARAALTEQIQASKDEAKQT